MEENITIEYVKEWIEKHKLSKGSFDRIMRDLIYNCGHNEIDNPYLRDWLIKNTQKFQDLLPVELNENQQVVLEWLKQVSGTEGSLTRALYSLYHLNLVRKEYFDNLTIDTKEHQLEVRSALRNLSRKQEAQILAAFAEWGMKNDQ